MIIYDKNSEDFEIYGKLLNDTIKFMKFVNEISLYEINSPEAKEVLKNFTGEYVCPIYVELSEMLIVYGYKTPEKVIDLFYPKLF